MRGRSALRAGAVLAVGGSILVLALPRVTGAPWGGIAAQLAVLGPAQLALLLALWLLGLYAHTFVATSALPDLSHRQALTLNLSGSAVSNVLPFGGAAGVGLTYAMARSWGHPAEGIGAFATLVNLWNIGVKLVLPVLGAVALLAYGGTGLPGLRSVAVASGAALLGVGLLAGLALRDARIAAAAGRVAERLAARVVPNRPVHLVDAVVRVRGRVLHLLGRRWPRMLAAMSAYLLLQGLLLWVILQMLGAGAGIVPVFAAFAVGRALTLVAVTPGGVGFSETGSAALLVALGVAPTLAASGVLVFSLLTWALEIPVGGACGLVWWHRSRRIRVGAAA